MNSSRDGLGTLAKFTAPTIANGKVYVPTFSNHLAVYGLLTQKQLIVDVVNCASSLSGPVAPGEVVVVYGSGLGPSALAAAQVDSSGHLSDNRAGTQVLFNGTAAPLIYTRADQVAAIVPDGIAGQESVQVQVKYNGQTAPAFSTTPAVTAPGSFRIGSIRPGAGSDSKSRQQRRYQQLIPQNGDPSCRSGPRARG